jgi:hypothetical protein
MNTPKKTDFIPEIAPQDAHLVAPDTYQPYRDDEEDLLHEQRLKEIEAEINEKFGAAEPEDELGELPYDAEADRKRWDELEKDFDRVFHDAAQPATD